MNSINEKEKKLISVLDELKNLDLTNPKLQNNIENLSKQKNELSKNTSIEIYSAIQESSLSLLFFCWQMLVLLSRIFVLNIFNLLAKTFIFMA